MPCSCTHRGEARSRVLRLDAVQEPVRAARRARGDAQLVGTTDTAAVVLDGASAFVPCSVDTGRYVDTLGAAIVDELHDQAADLRTVVRRAIDATTRTLDLQAGESPSSTVAVVRAVADTVDVFLLGDSPVIVGLTDGSQQRITDERIHATDTGERDAYRRRLAAGHGYDAEHRHLLAALQRKQVTRRNVPGGYWIAEAEPEAAIHAVTARFDLWHVAWAVLCTDGAERPLEHLGLADWPTIASLNGAELRELLIRIHAWEIKYDPNGRALPRAKRHDDKTLCLVS